MKERACLVLLILLEAAVAALWIWALLHGGFGLCFTADSMLDRAMKTKGGFTLVEIMIVVAIIGLLAAIAIPNFVKARENAQLNSILNNLRIIEGAKDQWALEQKKGTGDAVTLTNLTDYIKGGGVKPVVGEVYDAVQVGSRTTATIPVKLGSYSAGGVIFSD